MGWWFRQFEDYHLFRRIVLLLTLALVAYVTQLSFTYATHALEHPFDGPYVIGVITVLQAPIVALMGYSFKIYSQSRSQDVKSIKQ